MADETPEVQKREFTETELRTAMVRSLEQLFVQGQAQTETLLRLRAQLLGVEAHTKSVAQSVDENESQVETDRQVRAAKDLVTHLYEKSHQYVTIVIGGAFAAYFTTLAVLSSRFSDKQLLVSALLMTISLTIFVLWEILSISAIGWHSMRGDLGKVTHVPRWQQIGWPIAMFASLVTALPAVGMSLAVYIRHLGGSKWLSLFS